MRLSPEQREQYELAGYVVADDAVEPGVLPALREAARRVKSKVRAESVHVFTHRAPGGEAWAIRGLFAPELGEPLFVEYLVSRPVLEYAHAFLGDALRLGGILLYTNPLAVDYSFGWHRDMETPDGTEAEELAALNRPLLGLRWHLALVADCCLMVVPGSHHRSRTARERECLVNRRHDAIPGQTVITLEPGQTVFWNGNLIHRGTMWRHVERFTLVGAWRRHRDDDPPEQTDPRLRWMLAEDVRPVLPESMRPYYDRWRALQLADQATARGQAFTS